MQTVISFRKRRKIKNAKELESDYLYWDAYRWALKESTKFGDPPDYKEAQLYAELVEIKRKHGDDFELHKIWPETYMVNNDGGKYPYIVGDAIFDSINRLWGWFRSSK